MTRRNSRKGRGRSSSPFVMLPWHQIDSQGWHALSPHARLAYIELVRLYNGANNGRIALSARRLARLMPCDKATASRALRELDDAGFIETMRVGTFTLKNRLASEYRLCNYPCDVTGNLPNRKWNGHRWSPSDGTSETYRTGAQTRHKEAKSTSTVRSNSTAKLQSAASTVPPNRTHLESAMGGTLNGCASQGSAQDQYPDVPATFPNHVFKANGAEAADPETKTSDVSEPAVDGGFPELPSFLDRRTRVYRGPSRE